jgi:hypothetical protein
MLSKLRCPHTRVLNFFTDVDPLISVGSIIATAPGQYVWRCHIVDHRCGMTPDAVSAEANLRRSLEMPGVSPSRKYYARREVLRTEQSRLS